LTPAVLGSALFVAICAVFAITFVAARGGLQMPIAASPSLAAVASTAPTVPPPTETPTPSLPAPTATPALPSPAPSARPTAVASPISPPTDPLFALPRCPDQPGCFEYVIQRGDYLSAIATRFAIPMSTVLALNPEIADPSTIVVGNVLYLGRDPRVRLEPCGPDTVDCWLYVVQPGDRLAIIAERYGMTIPGILAANPEIEDENTIFSGQVLRLYEAIG
jgi:nucleoid-associated protein YgaU